MVAPRRAWLLAVLLLLTVTAVPARAADQRLEQAIEEAGLLFPPVGETDTPVGRLALAESRLLAARHGQPVRFTLTLHRDVERGTVAIDLPRRWSSRPESGLRAMTLPHARGSARGAAVRGDRQSIELVLDGARAGSEVTAEFLDTGIPAGTYALPVRYTGADGATQRAGRLEIRFYAPAREETEDEHAPPWSDLRQVNVTSASFDQSESFISVTPGNEDRILVGGNGGVAGYSAWISTNGGSTWTERVVPTTADVAGSAAPILLETCCDPMSAADANGNFWYGGLDFDPDSHIHVSRIAAGTNTFVNTVALKSRTPSATQDKPMMTIDNKPTSPTFGRLYVVWDEPQGGGVNVVVVQCDTRPGGVLDAANCDNADNWTAPVSINKGGPGSYIYADVSVGPDGKVYVVWWNYSNTNAIVGATCASACDSASSWSSAATIATLNASFNSPLPFACPIVAQPGGRASTGSNVEVDISGTATEGRVWVAWSDLRAGSGTTKCADNGVDALSTNLTFDSLAKSAVNALPGTGVAATRLLSDGEGGGQTNSDDWFPWITVDQTTGTAYADFYSTRDDSTRRTTNFYLRTVSADGSVGTLTKASTTSSNYSNDECCNFGNDYGDYTGLDATNGFAFPVWSGTIGSNGEILMDRIGPNQAPTAVIGGPDSAIAGDAVSFSAAGSSDPDGTIASYEWDLDGNGSFETATATAAAQTAFATAGTYAVKLRVIDNRGATSPAATKTIDVVARPVATPTPTPTATPTPTPAPFARLARDNATTRVRKRAVKLRLVGCAGCRVTMTLRTAGKVARTRGARRKRIRLGRGTGSFSAAGRSTVEVKLSRASRKLVRRLRRVKLEVVLVARDASGRTARSTGRVTLRR